MRNDSKPRELLQELGLAIRKRNPKLASLLRDGMPEREIRKQLRKLKVSGSLDCLINWYAWHDGTGPSAGSTIKDLSIFPDSTLCLEEFELMSLHFREFVVYAKNNPDFAPVAGRRYFPILWDSSSRWVVVDLQPSKKCRVLLYDSESSPMQRELYKTFESFVSAAVKANETNARLSCFDEVGPI